VSGYVNKVILVGNLGKDPEVRVIGQGGKVVNLSVVTNKSWKDKNTGERKERPQWHNVVIWNERLGEIVEQFGAKGRKVYIEGELQSRKYTDNAGAERVVYEVVIERFNGDVQFLDSRRDEDGERAPVNGGRQEARPAAAGTGARGKAKEDDYPDEIPF